MNKLLLTLAAITFGASAFTEVNHRPYISTSLAKAVMTTTDEVDVVEEKCDGSGWITHGDGHKTECPGCSACKDKAPKPVEPEQKYTCKCNTSNTYCNCVAAYGKCSCEKIPVGSETNVKKKLLRLTPRIKALFGRR